MFDFLRHRQHELRARLDERNQRVAGLKQKLATLKAGLATSRKDVARLREELVAERRLRAEAEVSASELERALIETESRPLPVGESLPLPPPALRRRVGSAHHATEFIERGRGLALEAAELLRAAGEDPARFRQALDFGCGCGRVARHLPVVFTNAQITGVDIDAEAIGWCAQHLASAGRFAVVPELPPSSMPSRGFDFIFAISVFTHLTLEAEQAWLAELARIATPDAVLLLTCLGDDKLAGYRFTPEQRFQVVDGFTCCRTWPDPSKPYFNLTSFHTEAAMRRLIGGAFEIIKIAPRSVGGILDAIVCRPKV